MSEFELLDRKERALRAEAEVLDKEIAEIRQRRDAVEVTLQRIADARATLEQLLAEDPAPRPEPEEGRVEPGADDAEPDSGGAGREEEDAEAVVTGWDSTPGPVEMEEARRRAVTLLATSGRKMRARAIAEAIGEDVSTAARVETTIRAPGDELAEKTQAREPYHFKLKQGPDARGAIRLQCPASGPSPSVNCARRDRLRPRIPATMPTRIVDLTTPRVRTIHTAARPTSQIPDAEHFTPPHAKTLPEVCCAGSITVPADAEAADWRLAKYRQDVHYLHTTWLNTYRPIRSHNEGANGRFKSGKLDIGNPKHRPAPGHVTQALLLAVMLTVANLTVLETWLTERDGPDELTTADFDASGPLPPLIDPDVPHALPTGRPRPPHTR